MAVSETPEQFDVFLCHNSKDKDAVVDIAFELQERGLVPWLDEWALPPGVPWLPLLEEQIGQIKSAAVFVGADGLGPWQEIEIQTLLRQFVRRQCPVIPVMLTVAPQQPELPLFLSGMTWVDFRQPKTPSRRPKMTPLDRLIWGITGQKPKPPAKSSAPGTPSATTATTLTSAPPPKTDVRDFVEDLGNGIRLEMVRIPGGAFLMGAPESEPESRDSERSQHRVTVPEFWLGKFPVTQAQWKAVAALPQVERVLEIDPSSFKGNNLPVECVSWLDAMEFCARLSRETGNAYRLPSEAEWEYACRAKTITPYYFGDSISPEQANFGENKGQTTEVGSFPANGFGLYDMHGNVWEWCADDWHKNYDGAPTDGSAWCDRGEDASKARRGGSWNFNPRYCRSAYRLNDPRDIRSYTVGFRVCCDSPRTRPLSV